MASSSTLSTTLNTAVVAPLPIASVSSATAVNSGLRRSGACGIAQRRRRKTRAGSRLRPSAPRLLGDALVLLLAQPV